jgi:SAM-dependent methyltransferase
VTLGDSGYRSSHQGSDVAAYYDSGFQDPHTAQGLAWQLEQWILPTLLDKYVPARARVLDFACGTGRILGWLEHRFPRPTGVDVSPDMIEVARRRCGNARFVVGDVTRTPDLVAGHYDLVTAFRFFLNAEPDLRSDVLAFLRGLLVPDGILIANFHLNPWSARGLYLQARWGGRREPMLSPASARRMLAESGFAVLEVIGYEYLPYRRDGARQTAPALRARVERALIGRRLLNRTAGTFLVVATPAGRPS